MKTTKKMITDNMISFDDVIEQGFFKRSTLYTLTSKKKIEHFKIGKRIFFEVETINKYLENLRRPVKAEVKKWNRQKRKVSRLHFGNLET